MVTFNDTFCKHRMRIAIKQGHDPNGPAGKCVDPYCEPGFLKCKQKYHYGDHL